MLVIRADASAAMGMGHVMRCLALAQQWKKQGGQVCFCSKNLPESLLGRLWSEGMNVAPMLADPGTSEDAETLMAIAKNAGVEWIVVDGYQFGTEYQEQLKSAGLKVLFLDDYGHCEHYVANVVMNQNLGAEEEWYTHRSSETQLLLGSEYALLRQEFLRPELPARNSEQHPTKLLITLGGSDPENITGQVLTALQLKDFSMLNVKVVIGGSNPHSQKIQQQAVDLPLGIEILQDVADMSTLMEWADLAICAGGSSNWELSYWGLPRIVIVIAENQQQIAQALEEQGAALRLDASDEQLANRVAELLTQLLDNSVLRKQCQTSSQRLVDGQGAARVVDVLQKARSIA